MKRMYRIFPRASDPIGILRKLSDVGKYRNLRIPNHSDAFRHPTTSSRNPIPRIPTNSYRIRWDPTVRLLVLAQMKPARSDPVRRKKFRSDPVGKLSDSNENPNKIQSNLIVFHRILTISGPESNHRTECPGG